MHQKIDLRRPLRHLAHVERPLVPLEEDHRIHRPGVRIVVEQELPLVAHPVRRSRNEARQHLHVGARDVPAELDRRQPELRLRQSLRQRARLERETDRTEVSGRIDARAVEAARTAHRKHHILRQNGFKLLRFAVEGDRPRRPSGDGDQFSDGAPFGDLHPRRLHRPDQRETHLPRRVRPAAGRPPLRIVVGLVADVLPELVMWKRHPEVDQMHETAHRQRRFHQRHVAVHRAAVVDRMGQLHRGIRFAPVDAELVVGLLVAAGVDRSAAVQPLREQQQILDAQLPEPERRRQAGRAGADHQCVNLPHHSRPISMPPSTLITCPVE